ncbi:MAG: RNA polymerase sigma factor [Bacteroidetes bacterium]|nr:RNA polymerase sigma factor [Bacteroidota bacterium]
MASTPHTINEAQLVLQLQHKNSDAFNTLYENYSAALYGVVLKIVKNDVTLAEDITQDAFIKIWSNVASYDKNKGTLFTWMLNIVRNTAIDRLRSINRKYTESIDEHEYLANSVASENIKTDNIGVGAVVKKLKPELSTVINLAYFGGYTQEEISKELNIPIGTIKTRTRNALIELRKIFS